MSAPERIYLQDAGDYSKAAALEVTWCVEPQDDGATEYIRADLVAQQIAAAEAAAYERAANWHDQRVEELKSQIEKNNEYLAREGITYDSAANDYCRDNILGSRLAAKAIRAMIHPNQAAALEAVKADALQVPEVEALVEAACGLLDAYSAIVGPGNPWGDSLRAALAAMKEG